MRKLIRLAVVAALAVTAGVVPGSASAAPTPAPPGAATRWCADLAAGVASIDVMGHSVMASHGAPSEAAKWTAVLSGLLNGDGLPTSVWTGAAIGGSTVAQYLPGGPFYYHTQFAANSPSLVMTGWELNEWSSGISPATFKAQYQQFINEIRRFSPTSSIVLVHSPWAIRNPGPTAPPYTQYPYADVINQLAAENGTLLLRLENSWPTDNRFGLYSDGIHHSAAGMWQQATITNAVVRGWCRRG